ncbi:NUDIX domain-containing protein [Patescibacteria group bacterium]|nr:NUDIX domain-containing protein [Patescibacteria group bacterium]
MAKTKREFSAGGAVYKKDGQQILWLVCQHSGYHKWVLPKGLIDPGETAKQTAVREVEEECGIKTKIIAKLPDPERYIYTMNGVKIFKLVQYFLMEYVSGDIKNHDFEMEAVEWLDYDTAHTRLNFHGAKKVLVKAKQLLEEKANQPRLI